MSRCDSCQAKCKNNLPDDGLDSYCTGYTDKDGNMPFEFKHLEQG